MNRFLTFLHSLGFRVIHRPRTKRSHLSMDEQRFSGPEIALQKRHVPPPAMQPRRTIVGNKLEHGLGSLTGVFDAANLHRRLHGHGLPRLQIRDASARPAVLVAARTMMKQIRDGVNLQSSQRLGPLTSPSGQAGHRRGQGDPRGHGGIGRDVRFAHDSWPSPPGRRTVGAG